MIAASWSHKYFCFFFFFFAAEADLSVALAMTKELHEELKIRDEEHAQVQSKTQIGAGKCTVVCGGSCTRRNCERSAAGKA